MSEATRGTGTMIRLALRRDRWLLTAWIVGLAAMAGISAGAVVGLYPDEASRVAASEAVNATTSLVALYGPIFDPTSLGALSMFKLTAFGAAIIAIVMVFIVIRHTRAEEETGRLELLGAQPMSRFAPLLAAYVVAFSASLGIGLVSALALIGAGLPAGGSLAFGFGWAFSGIAFAAIAGIFAQVTESARTARGLGLASIAFAYVLRAVGDVAQGGSWLSWLSPIGWMQQVRAYAGDRWWVLLLPIALTAVSVPIALALRARRDLGAGMVQERPGPAYGRIPGLLGLAWRLQRGVFVAWILGFAFFGFLLGSLADSLTGFLDSPQAAELIARIGGTDALTDAFLAAEVSIAGLVVAGYGVAAAARLRSEEVDEHAELLLAQPVSRVRWAASHIAVALLGIVAIMVVTGLAIGVGSAIATSDGSQIMTMLAAGLARVPAAWVFAGLLVLAFGVAPRLIAVVWAFYAASVAVAELGPLWELPQWVLDLSPFTHSPMLPAQGASLAAIWPLLGIAVALLIVGMMSWRRRDVAP